MSNQCQQAHFAGAAAAKWRPGDARACFAPPACTSRQKRQAARCLAQQPAWRSRRGARGKRYMALHVAAAAWSQASRGAPAPAYAVASTTAVHRQYALLKAQPGAQQTASGNAAEAHKPVLVCISITDTSSIKAVLTLTKTLARRSCSAPSLSSSLTSLVASAVLVLLPCAQKRNESGDGDLVQHEDGVTLNACSQQAAQATRSSELPLCGLKAG